MALPWTTEDVTVLTALCGDMPWPLVVREFNQRQPPRSNYSLLQKAYSLGLRRRSEGEYIPLGVIAKLTGYSIAKIRGWIKTKGLQAYKDVRYANAIRYISRTKLRAFAKRYPQEFGGISKENLTQLFDSELLAEQIYQMRLPIQRQNIRFYCVETGQQFNSIGSAEKLIFAHEKTISRALRNGTPIAGRHYRCII